MKSTINTKILFSLIIIILIPFIILGTFNFYIDRNNINYSYLELLKDYCHKESEVIISFKNNEIIKSKEYFKRFFIMDQDLIIYDSDNKLNNKNIKTIISKYPYYSETRFTNNSDKDEYKLITIPSEKYKQIKYKPLFLPSLFLIIIMFSMIFSIIFFSKTISKNLLKPLSKLNLAISKISKGNFDIEIPTCETKEMEAFSKNLTNMKNQLKENWNQHHIYNQSRKELLASITHDLKTPLSSIKGYVEALQDGIAKDEETYNQYLNVINEKSDKLNSLIDDLFIFTKLDLNELTYYKEKINSKFFLNNYLNSKIIEFKESKIELIISPDIISTHIYIDPKRMIQVLENIISNAKKFTNNYIKVSTTISNKNLLIHIEDDGIGISKKNQKNIFNLFYKEDDSRQSNNLEGSGIGLNICKHIVEAHNGKINLYSELNKKTIFTIVLPLYLDN